MAITINGERIEETAVEAEMDRMRPRYRQTFPDQKESEQEKQLREWARENIVERVILRQEAAGSEDVIPRAAIEERLETLRNQHGGDEGLRRAYGLTEETRPEFEKELDLQLRVERLVDGLCADLPEATDDEGRAHYTAHREDFTIPERVRAGHIVKHVDAETPPEEAEKAIRKIQERMKAGEPFEKLASETSDCPDDDGGLGWFPRGEMVPEFEDVVFGMTPGEVSDVFSTPFGFHIAKLYEREAERVRPYAEVRDPVLKRVAQERRDARLAEFLDEKMATARIEIIPEKPPARKKDAAASKTGGRRKDQGAFRKPLSSVLVKPSGPDCNMRCRYCFYVEKGDLFTETPTHRMNEEVLEAMVKQVLTAGPPHVNFGWQGGEPSLMGLDFYKKAVEFQRRYGRGRTVGNGFQTNGLLIDEDWAAFFRDHSFLVGLSLDGPRHVHDHYRVTAGGAGTFDKVSATARLLVDKGVQANALVVLSDYSVRHVEEIYAFHKDLGLRFMQFIPCVETLPGDPGKPAPFTVDPREFGDAMRTLFDLWMEDFRDGRPTTSIRFFDSLFHIYVDRTPPECTLLEKCGIYVVVEHNGDVYSCDFFVDPEWRLGNVLKDDLEELLNSERQNRFGRIKSTLPEECRACPWLGQCRGGCPKDRLGEPGVPHVNYLCEGYKAFFEHADGRLRGLAETWKKAQAAPGPAAEAPAPTPPSEGKVGRNDPCPCGSGLKYKKCCGK